MTFVSKTLFIFLFSVLVNATFAQNVVYVYGDVSAKGAVPSGNEKPFHQTRLNDTGKYGMSDFKKAIEETGLNITEVYDAKTKFKSKFLKEIDVLILASNQKKFSKKEIKSIQKWIKKGGGLIAWSDGSFSGSYKHIGKNNTLGKDSNNLITEKLGMHFFSDNEAGNYLVKNYTQNHFINKNNPYGGIHFRAEGASFIRVSKPAVVLAKGQEGGLGGKLRLNTNDGFFNHETDATLAIATIEKGRVLGLFDKNIFSNNGDKAKLSHSDNKEFAQRIVLWAAGIEDNTRVSKKTITNTRINTPPIVSIRNERISEDTISLFAVVLDKDTDTITPEVTWKFKEGPVKNVVFKNNNSNTKSATITLPVKGQYTFFTVVKDGEFEIKKYITIDQY